MSQPRSDSYIHGRSDVLVISAMHLPERLFQNYHNGFRYEVAILYVFVFLYSSHSSYLFISFFASPLRLFVFQYHRNLNINSKIVRCKTLFPSNDHIVKFLRVLQKFCSGYLKKAMSTAKAGNSIIKNASLLGLLDPCGWNRQVIPKHQ